MKRFKSIVLAALAVFMVAAYLPVAPASAQSSSLSIAPKKNYVIEPGKSVDDKLTVRNLDSSRSLELYLRVIDFTYTDDTGTPKLLLETNNEPTTWSLRPYLRVPESVTVPAGGSVAIDTRISIPAKLGAGSYYSAIIYSTSAPEGGNVGLAASGVTLAFANVPGDVTENLVLKKFGAYDSDSNSYSNFTMKEPKVIGYTLENQGNVTEAPVGSITLRNWFGQEYVLADVNPRQSLALIGQERTFQACIKLANESADFKGTAAEESTCVSPGLWPGYYSANLDLFYGQNGNMTKEITKSGYFWYLPLWFLIVVIILLLALAFTIWRSIVWVRGGSFKLGGHPRTRKSRRRR